MIFLSYTIDSDTPTYGNRNKVTLEKKNSIKDGGTANDSYFASTVHVGTHIDMPYHFHDDGQTITDYPAEFWHFNKPLILEVEQQELIVREKLIEKLEKVEGTGYDILIVKTGICHRRDQDSFWSDNYGFHPDVYEKLASDDRFKDIRVFGFDSISVSSIQDRMLGRESHRAFLNPERPILLLEDMDLTSISENSKLNRIIVSPLRLANCDGMPCTVFAE